MMLQIMLAIFALTNIIFTGHAPLTDPTENQLIYIEILPNGDKHIVIITETGEAAFLVLADDCYSLSRDFSRVAVSKRVKPKEVVIYILKSGSLLSKVPWQAEWTLPCQFGVSEAGLNQLSVIINRKQLEVIDFYTREERRFQFNNPASIAALHALQGEVEFSPQSLPGNIPENALYLLSPNQDFVVYQRCLRDFSVLPPGASCLGRDEYVVFNLIRQEEVTILRNPPALMNIPEMNLASYFTWSPTGRYLAYESNLSSEKTIFDVTQRSYVKTDAIHTQGYYRRATTRWSPDEQKIAYLLEPRNSPSLDVRAVSVFDLNTESYNILNAVVEPIGSEWAWLPDGTAIALIEKEGPLLRIGLGGTVTLLAQNVERVFTTYSGRD